MTQRWIPLVALLPLSLGCPPQSGDDTGESSGTSEGSASVTSAPTTGGSESGGSESGGSESGGSESGGSESGGSESGTGFDTDSSGALDGFLDTCGLEEPCDDLEFYCDYDGCQGQASGPEEKCAFAALRDGTGLLQISDLLAEPHAYLLAPVPGPERAVLKEVLGTGTLERCTLREAAFFQGCIDAPDDLCATSNSWVTDCVPELAPMCPGL